MLLTARHIRQHIDIVTSDLRERLQRLEDEQAEVRSLVVGERHLQILAANISGAAHAAPVIGSALENFARAMRTPLPRDRAGGLARAAAAWRYSNGTFLPEVEKFEAYKQEYERNAAGGRVRAATASRFADGKFASD